MFTTVEWKLVEDTSTEQVMGLTSASIPSKFPLNSTRLEQHLAQWMFIRVDSPSEAILSACAQGSGLSRLLGDTEQGLSCLQGVPRSMITKRRNPQRKLQKVEPPECLSSARQLISLFFPPLVPHHFSIMFWGNIIQITLLEKRKKSNHYKPQMKKWIPVKNVPELLFFTF